MCSFILCYRKVIQARTFSAEFKSSYLLGVLQEHKTDTIIIMGLLFAIFQWYKFVYLCIQFGKSYTFCLVMWWILSAGWNGVLIARIKSSAFEGSFQFEPVTPIERQTVSKNCQTKTRW